jgi:hypothetical protein
MTRPDSPEARAAALRTQERILLFCAASLTEWQRAGITGATVTAMVIKGLVERNAAGKLALTKQGRAVLATLLMAEDELNPGKGFRRSITVPNSAACIVSGGRVPKGRPRTGEGA